MIAQQLLCKGSLIRFRSNDPMTQAVHDTFTKEWMKQMLSDYGDIEVEVQIRSEVRTIDILFFPAHHALDNLADLGLLGQILVAPAAIEAFRNAVPEWEIHNCRNKRFAKTRDTLLLRLLGKGKVQADAIHELVALPPNHPYRQITLENIAIFRINLEMRQNRTKQIKEVIMDLSPAYEKWRQKTLAEGEARGEVRGEVRGELQGQKYASISIARNMLQEGLPIDLITKVTGLTSAEITQLRS
jgi:hypothetical protein